MIKTPLLYFYNRLIISWSSRDARVYLNFTRNSIPDKMRTTCTVHAGIDRNDQELFHQIIISFLLILWPVTLFFVGCFTHFSVYLLAYLSTAVHSYLKDWMLVVSLVVAVGGCWFAFAQHRYSQSHVKVMLKEMESLQKAEDTLREMQEK